MFARFKALPQRLQQRFYHAGFKKYTPELTQLRTIENGIALSRAGIESIGPLYSLQSTPIQEKEHTILMLTEEKIHLHEKTDVKAYALNFRNPCDLVYPDILYSIPQDTWEAFTGHLNPDIVQALNMNTHRHLWAAYNYATDAPPSAEIALKRARMIGAWHFLLPMIWAFNPSQLARLRWYSKKDQNQLELLWKTLHARLFQGDFSMELMAGLHPIFTLPFLRKVAFCPDFSIVLGLADAVLHYAAGKIIHPETKPPILHAAFEIDSAQEALARNCLPSSIKNPKEFGNLVHLWKKYVFKDNTNLFFSSRKNWETYVKNEDYFKKIHLYYINNYLSILFRDLLFREILQQTSEKNVHLNNIEKIIRYKFKQRIQQSNTPEQLEYFQERWNRNVHYINAVKSDHHMTWQPLIQETSIDSIQIKPITSVKNLKAHAKEMEHCAGGYVKNCIENKSDFFELTDHENKKSTLELVRQKQVYCISEHVSYKDNSAPVSHRKAAEKLLKQINDRSMAVNAERMQENKTYVFTYDINDLETQEIIYQAYLERKVLPAILTANSYQNMLQKSGLKAIIQEAIEQDLSHEIFSNCDRGIL